MIPLVLCATFSIGIETAQAGPCTRQINQFEAAIRQFPTVSSAGPTAPEAIGARLGHQPTPASVAAAETAAQSDFSDLLAKAKRLDARGKHAACMQALTDAKLMFDPQ